LPLGHGLANIEERVDDLARIGREYLHQQVLVEVDRPDRILRDAEGARLGGQDLESICLLVRDVDGLLCDVDVAVGGRLGRLGRVHLARAREQPSAGDENSGCGNACRKAGMLDAKCHHRSSPS